MAMTAFSRYHQVSLPGSHVCWTACACLGKSLPQPDFKATFPDQKTCVRSAEHGAPSPVLSVLDQSGESGCRADGAW